MAWPFNQRVAQITASDLLGWRTAARSGVGKYAHVQREQALRHSAVWACLRLRADLVSTMPVDVYRRVGGVQFEMPKPPVLVLPGGPQCALGEWLYSTQFDLDSTGNAFGIITARDGAGFPAVIELVPVTDVVVQVRDNIVSYRIAGKQFTPDQVWHEKQFTTSGTPVGLSPTAFAASSILGYLSAQQFAAEWFQGGAMPSAQLKNTAKILNETEAQTVKSRFKAAVETGDVFVTGKDWDYSMLSAKASEAMFLEERKFGIGDVCRFYGVPGDMIDAETTSGSITYANVTQRNLQLLVMNLGPAITRRESAISNGLLPKPRYAKFNTDALLRMDPLTRFQTFQIAVKERLRAPSELREIDNLPPFTEEQFAEFERLFPPRKDIPTPIG